MKGAIEGIVRDVHVDLRAGEVEERWSVGFSVAGSLGVVRIYVPQVDGDRLHRRLVRGENRAVATTIAGELTVIPTRCPA